VAGERGIWQRHYWEHCIRDKLDYQRHVDYAHVTLLKQGYVRRVSEWPYSSFHRYVAQGIYPENWCGDFDMTVGVAIDHAYDYAALIVPTALDLAKEFKDTQCQ